MSLHNAICKKLQKKCKYCLKNTKKSVFLRYLISFLYFKHNDYQKAIKILGKKSKFKTNVVKHI